MSKTAWLDDDMTEDKGRIVRRINRRMEDATELSHDYAELDQVSIVSVTQPVFYVLPPVF